MTRSFDAQETPWPRQEAAQARAAAAAAASRERAGLDRLQGMIAKAQAGSCGKLFISPEAGSGTLVQQFTLALHACARILATTGDAAGALALEPPPGTEGILTYCSDEGGPHTGRVPPALEGPFTWGAVICPKRTLK